MTDEELVAIKQRNRTADPCERVAESDIWVDADRLIAEVERLRADLATEKVLRKKAEDRLAGYQSAPVHMAATVLKGRLDKAEAEIARLKALFPACEFCGTEMPEGEQCQC